MTNRRRAAAIALVLAAASVLSLSACSSYGPPYACADWVQFDDAQAMYEEAELVVESVIGERTGEVRYSTGPGDAHTASVEVVHKGEPGVRELLVSAPRDYCTGGAPDPADDPLVEGERVLLFLRALDDETNPDIGAATLQRWTVLTPTDGILPFPEGADLPFAAD